MLIHRVIALLLISYVACGGAVVNQLHNHDHHGPCDSGHAEHHAPCPVSVFFANIAAETGSTINVTVAQPFLTYLGVDNESQRLFVVSSDQHNRAPPAIA